ncbi:MAG: hypothetical protein H2058_09800 [Muricauda sp.]|nr:D-Ala-D-Ala carboxypeptidase family metallohydrolase [Allomuricauda sp.]MBA4745543.1 hypothetical protein [Allomuricauda sp.]
MSGKLLIVAKNISKTAETYLINTTHGDVVLNSAKDIVYSAKENLVFGAYEELERQATNVNDDLSDQEEGLDVLYIDIYDDVESFSLTSNNSTNNGFGTGVNNNQKNLLGLIQETGCFNIEVNTKSGGVYNKEIEIKSLNTTVYFNKLDFDFELKRVDEECHEIEDDGDNLLSTTFVSTDEIRIQFREHDTSDLSKDGFGFSDIVWKTEGITENDGTVEIRENDDNTLHIFSPRPINRPTTGSRNPNEAISYKISCNIIGLKKEIQLTQDSKDILRQEYVDYNTVWIPTRDEVFLDTGDWNTGNYDYLAASGNNRFQEIWDNILTNYNTFCANNNIANDGLQVNSAYRNPQRNRAVGSVLINSNHTIGHAMDISILGMRTTQKWNFLRDAATRIQGVNAICEIGPRQVSCSNPNISHIHVAW